MTETVRELNYFENLNSINVNDKTEKKNGLTYLSWSYAWTELKKRYPLSIYTVYENSEGWNYFTDGRTGWVKTGVTVRIEAETAIHDIEHIEYLPIMDHTNKSIPLENITSFDVNKAIQRSLTKAIARHGLGAYIYAGEDLPESVAEDRPKADTAERATESAAEAAATETDAGSKPEPLATPNQVQEIRGRCTKEQVDKLCEQYGVSSIEELTRKEAMKTITLLKRREGNGK